MAVIEDGRKCSNISWDINTTIFIKWYIINWIYALVYWASESTSNFVYPFSILQTFFIIQRHDVTSVFNNWLIKWYALLNGPKKSTQKKIHQTIFFEDSLLYTEQRRKYFRRFIKCSSKLINYSRFNEPYSRQVVRRIEHWYKSNLLKVKHRSAYQWSVITDNALIIVVKSMVAVSPLSIIHWKIANISTFQCGFVLDVGLGGRIEIYRTPIDLWVR